MRMSAGTWTGIWYLCAVALLTIRYIGACVIPDLIVPTARPS